MLPNIQASSVFNFDGDPAQSYSNGIGFVNGNNGITATFHPGADLAAIISTSQLVADELPTNYFPFKSLSGNVLETALTLPQIFSGSSPNLGISFSTDLSSIAFNFGFNNYQYLPGFSADVTVTAYNNGALVGSETTVGAPPNYPCCYKINPEGIGSFSGAPFNEVSITASGWFNFEVDNIDVVPSSAVPEPTSLSALGSGLLVAAGVANRWKRSTCPKLPSNRVACGVNG